MLLKDSSNSNAALKKRNTVLVKRKNVIISGNKILNLRHISVPTNHCKADSDSTASALLLSPLQDMLVPSLLARENLGQVEGSSWEK